MRFADRQDAGRKLAQRLAHYKDEQPLVLGLPRGGVPVAYEVATTLGAPLDVWVVRKVGAPGSPELGVGAVAEGGVVYLDRKALEQLGFFDHDIQDVVRRKSDEVAQRVALFRGTSPPPKIEGRTVILVDDGIATGGTVRAAVQALRAARVKKIVLAVPVAASQSLEALSPLVDDTVCVHATPELYAIGAWYDDFRQVSDEEVVELLAQAPNSVAEVSSRELALSLPDVELQGTLSMPQSPKGLVLFAHGSGSSRFSPRNRHVASVLQRHGMATLLFDLLTPEEEAIDQETLELRFDIDLLARRLVQVTDFVLGSSRLGALPLGYFGSSTGAAAALVAAAERPSAVGAVVSRGGRPDLALTSLGQVCAPTLLIVGGEDHQVIHLNQRAYAELRSVRRLATIPGATHLFEEPGTLDEVARLAGEWFSEHLDRIRPLVPTSASETAAPS